MCSKVPSFSIAVSVTPASLYILKGITDSLQLSNPPLSTSESSVLPPLWGSIGGTCTVYRRPEPKWKERILSLPLYQSKYVCYWGMPQSHMYLAPSFLLSLSFPLPSPLRLSLPIPCLPMHACAHIHRSAKFSLLVSLMLFFRNSGLPCLGGTACCSGDSSMGAHVGGLWFWPSLLPSMHSRITSMCPSPVYKKTWRKATLKVKEQ